MNLGLSPEQIAEPLPYILSAKWKASYYLWLCENKDPRANKCVNCGNSVIGDPKYHQEYSEGLLIGVKHRRCTL